MSNVSTRTILSLCDYSGVWSEPYAQAGYEVIRVDMAHKDGRDIRLLERLEGKRIHGILAAPPCTVFAGSGARWPRTDAQMIDGLSVVDACLRAVVIYQPVFWAIENPVGKLVRYLGKPSLYFNPCDFAGYADHPEKEAYTKRTCLWGTFNAPIPKPVLPDLGSKMHRLPETSQRARIRSQTPQGFARAFMAANP